MSEELAAFLEKVQSDPELQQRLSCMNSIQEVIDEAAANGFLLNESDFSVPETDNPDSAALGNCFCLGYGYGKNRYSTCKCPVLGSGGGSICRCLLSGDGTELYCSSSWL